MRSGSLALLLAALFVGSTLAACGDDQTGAGAGTGDGHGPDGGIGGAGGAGGTGHGGNGSGGNGSGGNGSGGNGGNGSGGNGGNGSGGNGGNGGNGSGGSGGNGGNGSGGNGGNGGNGSGGNGGNGSGGSGNGELCANGIDDDGDGLSDCNDPGCFGNGCPDPERADVDFDCDGLSDLEEAGLGTDAADADSDGDGIADGVELGRTSPIPGTCPLFAGDRDAASTTDPTRSDSDGDGILDGAEDRDRDGAVDPGELDPTSLDSDGDGLPDSLEDQDHDGLRDAGELDGTNPDSDGDGLADGLEDSNQNGVFEAGETDPRRADTDFDGLPDGIEDLDHDGTVDADEADPRDFDSDDDGRVDGCEDRNANGIVDVGEPSPRLADTDGDGIADGAEDADGDCLLGPTETDPSSSDTDCDGLSDFVERTRSWGVGYTTDPRVVDTDGDGLSDGIEAGGNGVVPGSPCGGVAGDSDLSTATDPTTIDSDRDGLSDGCEDRDHDGAVTTGELDPLAADTDGDGLPDNVEDANGDCLVSAGETSGGLFDTDGDGIGDGAELRNGTSPLLADSDGDGLADGVEDPNQDGIVGASETSPLLADTDGDGLSDGTEDSNGNGSVDPGETDPRRSDTDGDGLSDAQELALGTNPLNPDSDGEGLSDSTEVALGTDPLNPDTDGDTLNDYVEVTAGTNPLDPLDPDPTVRSGIDAVCSPQNLKVVLFQNEPVSDWTIGLEQNYLYTPATIAGGETAATFDELVGGVAGLALDLVPPVAGGNATAQAQAILARISAAAGPLGATLVDIRNNGRQFVSRDGFGAVVGTQVSFTLAAATNPSSFRNALASAMSGQPAAAFAGLPAAGGAATTTFTIKFETLVRTGGPADRVLVVGALVSQAIFDNPALVQHMEVDDLSNGSALAKAWAGNDAECNPFVVSSLPAADFIWMADVSGSTDNDRGNIAAAAGTIFGALGTNGIDFRMGVVPHFENDRTKGAGNGGDLRSGFTRNQATFIADLNNTAGTDGCEFGLTAADNAITKALPRTAVGAPESATKLRPGVQLVVFYISDEHAQEIEQNICGLGAINTGQRDGRRDVPTAAQQANIQTRVQPFIDRINAENAVAFGQLIPLQAPFCADAEDSHGYYEVVTQTGGTFYRTCDNNPGAVLLDIINSVSGAASQFVLAQPPISATIKVGLTRAGTQVTTIVPRSTVDGYDFDPLANTIYFHGATYRPAIGDSVTVSYRVFTPAVPPPVCLDPLVLNPQTISCECPATCGISDGCAAGTVCDRDPTVCACVCAPDCGGTCGGATQCNAGSCSCECAPGCGGTCVGAFSCDMASCSCFCNDTTPGDGVPDCDGACVNLQQCDTASCSCFCPVDCGGCVIGTTCDLASCACVPDGG